MSSEALAQPVISASELQSWLQQGRPVVVVDIRRKADRCEWHIPGSLHVDAYDALKAGDTSPLQRLALPTDRPVVTVCQHGETARLATRTLVALGFDARTLAGGMQAWSLAWNTAVVPLEGSPARVVQVRRTGKGCLSYLIGSGGDAVVIDAAVDPTVYVQLAAENGWRIRRLFETHVHADHLMRTRALAELTGAALHLPRQRRVSYPFTPVDDGEQWEIGETRMTFLHTPGHTEESMCCLLDGAALFTGDTLFVDGVGRPDLEAPEPGAVWMHARRLYGSLQKLAQLGEPTWVLPGHAGQPVPFDGRPVAAALGEVKSRIADLLALDEEAFAAQLVRRIPETPPNYREIVRLNETGGPWPADPTALELGPNRCAVA